MTSRYEAIQTVPLHPVLAGLMSALPHPSQPFPEADRAKFLAAMEAVLRLLYDGNTDNG